MMEIAGYQIAETLYQGKKTIIYRGKHPETSQPVIIKVLKEEYPHPLEVANLKHQYEITKDLKLEGIIESYGLERYRNSYALMMEDIGGRSLDYILTPEGMEIETFLLIALQLAESLAQLHQMGIIHKDIKPHNIIINSSGLVKITDFSISTRLGQENPTLSHPNSLEGTVAYLSPEQTGRMNRSVDYRSDFYALGATFYELLAGCLPFASNDPMELIHCHIARQPVPLCDRKPQLPQVLSDIVMKLLAKTAEDRYQNALGLKADLELCLQQLQTTGEIKPFEIGVRDLSGQLLIPQKLYGRESEVSTLLTAFDRITQGTTEMMLVSGYSGIGKSALVNEVHKPIIRQRGYFIQGKFDQFKRDFPYHSIIQAFQGLLRQLLTENTVQICHWREKLLTALGENGQVIIDVIPEVELMIGPQPPVPELGPTASQNRFNRVFRRFIHVFAQKSHPLVLFLDDLQWADSASLQFLELLMGDPESQYLLFIGAYRDNEVSPVHPFIQTLEKIKQAGAKIHEITLKTLALKHIYQLVADTLHEAQRSRNLAELLFNKTQGNPFFLTQLLKALYQEQLLNFNYQTGEWCWDEGEIQAVGIADYNVVQLMSRNIGKLPATAQTLLKLAACIGNQFSLDVLAVVNKTTPTETAAILWSALQAGLVLPLSENYKIPLLFVQEEMSESILVDSRVDYRFLHDRVQQAAYSLIPTSEQQETHLKIGQLLLQTMSPAERKEHIFTLVNQLNFGVEIITDVAQRQELAELNLWAGKKAKLSTAYQAAVRYLQLGLSLLPSHSWQTCYELTLELHVEAVEAEYLTTNFGRAQELAEVVLVEGKTLLEKIRIYELRMLFDIAQNQMQDAMVTALQVLEMLGVELPLQPSQEDIGGAIARIQTLVGDRPIEALADLPAMDDPMKIAAMRIMMNLCAPAYIANPPLLILTILTMVGRCVEFGNSAIASFAYGYYGLLGCSVLGNIDLGYRAGKLSIQLLEKYPAKELKAKVYALFNIFVRHWKDHASDCIEPFREAIQSGLETGDIEHAGYCACNYSTYPFFLGQDLEAAAKLQAEYIDLTAKNKQEFSLYYIKIWRQMVLNLLGQSADKLALIGESFDETVHLPLLQQTNNKLSIFHTYLVKSILAFWFKDYPAALENAQQAEQYIDGALGFITVPKHHFYTCLALLAPCETPPLTSDLSENSEVLKRLEALAPYQEKLQHWAEHSPRNHGHRALLVQAEIARVKGEAWAAMELYEQAIQQAEENGYPQEEALFYEIAAEFYFGINREKIARTYLTEAYYGYVRWSAIAKVEDLQTRYPQYFLHFNNQDGFALSATQTSTVRTSSSAGDVLDLASAFKASQAIASEIILEQLLEKLMGILLESAGAQLGYLFLKKGQQLTIEAEISIEHDRVVIHPSIPISENQNLPRSIINYVYRTQRPVVLEDASQEKLFATDPYVVSQSIKSVLCLPILKQGKLLGLLYLENNLIPAAFTPDRLEVLNVLSSQAAISLENAILYKNLSAANEQLEQYSRTLEEKVQERTLEVTQKNTLLQQEVQERIQAEKQLQEKAEELETALRQLQKTQAQLIQTEKMSSLGQLVAGVAHEINNPINFISGNLRHSRDYLEDILSLLELYQECYPYPLDQIENKIEEIDLAFLISDFPNILNSMQNGAERIQSIVLSLRNFARHDEAEKKIVHIQEGIESTLVVLQHRLKDEQENAIVEVETDYGQLPKIECYPGQLNQVFLNIFNNALDALESNEFDPGVHPKLQISTRSLIENPEKEQIEIRIADNGPGMDDKIRHRIFDPFFTTKPVGQGTGLGLWICYQIVVEKHGGQILCHSQPGKGTEIVIQIPLQLPR